jgi:hypothetical protein
MSRVLKTPAMRTARVGSIIQFQIPSGKSIRNGKIVQDYKMVKGKVYLTEPNLVAAIKGHEGHPYVVESYQLIRY